VSLESTEKWAVGTCADEFEAVSREAVDWRAQYRIDPATTWSECRLLDISLTGALVELTDELPDAALTGQPFFLHINSIAEDDVGIVMRAIICDEKRGDSGHPVVEIEFSARREERILLHLLVRLHALV
jgi:hypothetical protein